MKKRSSQLKLSLLSKSYPYDDKNAIDFKWSGVQEKERKILLRLTSLKITKASWWQKFYKKVTEWLFDDCKIVPNEKKN